MAHLAIRCHPCVPVAADDLQSWFEGQLHDLRGASERTARLSRLTQRLPSGGLDVGWLLEFELPDLKAESTPSRLAHALEQMRVLGLQPTVLVQAACRTV